MRSLRIFALAALALMAGCHRKSPNNTGLLALLALSANGGGYDWSKILPPGFPVPAVPADNPMTNEKVTLGRYLFYDRRMSGDQTQACATCHIQAYAFSDTRQTGLGSGSTKQSHPRSPQQLVNVAYHTRYTWANNTVATLEDQAKAPMYGTVPVELGLTDPAVGTPEVIARLRTATDVDYAGMFAAAFGGNGSEAISDLNIRRAIASFERTMLSGNSYFDQYRRTGDAGVLPSWLNATRVNQGAALFNAEGGDCFHCHGGFNYTDTASHASTAIPTYAYHQNGIHDLAFYDNEASIHAGAGNPANVVYPNGGAAYEGLYGATLTSSDKGRFRAPTLRNIAVTHPFMHDGSFKCSGYVQPATNTAVAYSEACTREALKAVVHNYAQAGQGLLSGVLISSIEDLPNAALSTNAGGEEEQIVEFLMSLTDPEFLTRESLSNPACGNANFVSCP